MKVFIIGDLMIDIYVNGNINRMSPEAPVPVFEKEDSISKMGGALNVANCFSELGDDVFVIGRSGYDEDLLKNIIPSTIKHFLVNDSSIPSTKKTRILSNNNHLLRIDDESNKKIDFKQEKEVMNVLSKNVKNIDALVLSDYNKGFLTKSLISNVIKLCKKNKIKTYLDPKFRNVEIYKNINILKANKKEASFLSNINISDKSSLEKAIKKIYDYLNLELLIITLSEEGCAMYDGKKIYSLRSFSKGLIDVTGAGDTFFSSFISRYHENKDKLDSLKFASYSSAISLKKMGCYSPSRNEILELFENEEKN